MSLRKLRLFRFVLKYTLKLLRKIWLLYKERKYRLQGRLIMICLKMIVRIKRTKKIKEDSWHYRSLFFNHLHTNLLHRLHIKLQYNLHLNLLLSLHQNYQFSHLFNLQLSLLLNLILNLLMSLPRDLFLNLLLDILHIHKPTLPRGFKDKALYKNLNKAKILEEVILKKVE